jgi:hypothetical protein
MLEYSAGYGRALLSNKLLVGGKVGVVGKSVSDLEFEIFVGAMAELAAALKRAGISSDGAS